MSNEAGTFGEEAKGSIICPQTNGLKKGLKYSRKDKPVDGHSRQALSWMEGLRLQQPGGSVGRGPSAVLFPTLLLYPQLLLG